jgi:hypothetical protein
MTRKMKQCLLTLALPVPLLLCLGCWSQQNQQLLESGGLRTIPAATFLRARPGMSRSEITTLFGSAGRHEFTLSEAPAVYLCVCYMPEPEILYYFVFRNGTLWKTVDRPNGWFSGSQPFAHPFQPWPSGTGAFGDEQRVRRIVGDGLNRTPEQMRAQIEKAESWLREQEKRSDWNIPLPLWEIVYLVGSPAMQFKIGKNAQFEQRQNGLRIGMGTTPDQAAHILGSPTGRETDGRGRSAIFYGQHVDLQLVGGDEFEARRVKVIYDGGKAVTILSHDFSD